MFGVQDEAVALGALRSLLPHCASARPQLAQTGAFMRVSREILEYISFFVL